MKRILWLAVIFLLLIPQAAALGEHQTQEILSSFSNSGFETNPTQPSNGWSWPSTDWVWDGSIAHSGTHSARVTRSGGGETASVYSTYVPVQPSTIYTLTYWMRSQVATNWPIVMLLQYTSGQNRTGPWQIAYANIENGTHDWAEVNYRFQTMPDATQLRLRLYLYTSTTGTFWFDDFSLDQGTPAVFPFQAGFPVVASGWVNMSSPSVVDINNDGSNELLIGAGSAINGWNKTGALLPGFPLATGDRSIIAQIALADLDHDGRMEIAAGTRTPNPPEGQCRVFVWQDNGQLLPGWPQSVAWDTQYSNSDCWITSVVSADINGDQNLEILASSTNNGSADDYAPVVTPNLYAWHLDGSLVSGNWPNYERNLAIYGALAAGDLNGDKKDDIVVSRDFINLNVYGSGGQSLPGWPIATFVNRNDNNFDQDGAYFTEQRIEYSVNAPIIADLEGDGTPETIVAGHVKGPGNVDAKLNSALLVLEPNGTRKPGWESAALGNGILAQDDLSWQGPAVADLNKDGKLEIVVATEDGWIRAYKADKTLLWAFDYTQGATLFASDPVIGDIDGDGNLEVVFGTRVPMTGGADWDGPVGLWALKADGSVMPGFPLPIPTPGMRAAPTLADLDGDGKLDILIATLEGQIIVWDTPTQYNPLFLPWPTGRHDLQRTGAYLELDSVTLTINQSPGGTITATPPGPYHLNDPVTLTATTNTGWSFSGWTGDCNGQGNPCNLSMSVNKTVSVIFIANASTSTPTRTATSTPTPAFTNTSTPSRTATFTPTRTNAYTSTPTRTATFTPTPAKTSTPTPTRTASSTELPIVTLAINPSTGGTIAASPAGPYHLNDTVTLTATSNQGYYFFNWTGDASGTTNPTTIIMNGNKTVGAYFQQGTILESFDSLSGWTVKGVGNMTLDAINYFQGIASIRLTMPVSNGYEYITKAVKWDLSVNQGNLKFWLFVSSTGSPSSFKIVLSNNTAIKNYFLANVPIQPGWNLITLSTANWDKYGKASWTQPFVRVQLQGLGSGAVYYLVDGLTIGDINKPGVSLPPDIDIFIPIVNH